MKKLPIREKITGASFVRSKNFPVKSLPTKLNIPIKAKVVLITNCCALMVFKNWEYVDSSIVIPIEHTRLSMYGMSILGFCLA